MDVFVSELALAERFYVEQVEPILRARFPAVAYSAALLGDGSGVLGFDTPLSRDHDWGPRLQVFVAEESVAPAMDAVLDEQLADVCLGYPVRFSKGAAPPRHQVEVETLETRLQSSLGVASVDGIESIDWLTFPQQKLRSLTSGAVFADDAGGLAAVRRTLAYYPTDVWLYLLASGFRLLSQEMPFVGRCGDLGDELGSRTIAAHQARRAMLLLFLIEREYAPYNKWLGTALMRLTHGPAIEACLSEALASSDWHERQRQLADAYSVLVGAFNELRLLPDASVTAEPFFDRPYLQVLGPPAADIQALIGEQGLRTLPLGVGGIDQVTDNVDVLVLPGNFRRLRAVYGKAQ